MWRKLLQTPIVAAALGVRNSSQSKNLFSKAGLQHPPFLSSPHPLHDHQNFDIITVLLDLFFSVVHLNLSHFGNCSLSLYVSFDSPLLILFAQWLDFVFLPCFNPSLHHSSPEIPSSYPRLASLGPQHKILSITPRTPPHSRAPSSKLSFISPGLPGYPSCPHPSLFS